MRGARCRGRAIAALVPFAERARTAVPLAVAAAEATRHGELAYEALATHSAKFPHGCTPYGQRTRAPLGGGWTQGPNIAEPGVASGPDWQRLRTGGNFALCADDFMTTGDGTRNRAQDRGLSLSSTKVWRTGSVVTTAEYGTPIVRHERPKPHLFICVIGPGPGFARAA